MAIISDNITRQTVDFLDWFIKHGCSTNASELMVEEQLDRAETLREKWRDELNAQ